MEWAQPTAGAPISIKDLADFLLSHEVETNQEWFESKVREILPEQSTAILNHEDQEERIQAFRNAFEERYFPIDRWYMEMTADFWEESMEEEDLTSTQIANDQYAVLREGIPILLQGLSWEEKHEIWQVEQAGPDICLMTLMAQPPGTGIKQLDDESRNMRTSWMESAMEFVSEETLRRIPEKGIPLSVLEIALKETPLEGAALAALWGHSATGNPILDNTDNNEDTGGEKTLLDWDCEELEEISDMWKEAEGVLKKMDKIAKWMEQDRENRFRQVLEFTLERVESVPENFLEER